MQVYRGRFALCSLALALAFLVYPRAAPRPSLTAGRLPLSSPPGSAKRGRSPTSVLRASAFLPYDGDEDQWSTSSLFAATHLPACNGHTSPCYNHSDKVDGSTPSTASWATQPDCASSMFGIVNEGAKAKCGNTTAFFGWTWTLIFSAQAEASAKAEASAEAEAKTASHVALHAALESIPAALKAALQNALDAALAQLEPKIDNLRIFARKNYNLGLGDGQSGVPFEAVPFPDGRMPGAESNTPTLLGNVDVIDALAPAELEEYWRRKIGFTAGRRRRRRRRAAGAKDKGLEGGDWVWASGDSTAAGAGGRVYMCEGGGEQGHEGGQHGGADG
ncbi:hypothetical protein K438DRAFT_1770707 [Mycena galopus ATCC 62051]|nr:hypothetical protein K438DRAFT_1770707 [Mycena galopus ATCC 62051]